MEGDTLRPIPGHKSSTLFPFSLIYPAGEENAENCQIWGGMSVETPSGRFCVSFSCFLGVIIYIENSLRGRGNLDIRRELIGSLE